MKHIKLFEAFGSKALNATLKHIGISKEKENFLNTIKTICKKYDIPESKLDDDLFTYLPFNRALRYNNVVLEDQVCDARDEYIRGERCENGKVKRNWGKGFRIVDCSACKGTGIKPKTSSLSMIKFWFSADGKFIATTAVDGIYRETGGTRTFSTNRDDYEVVKRVPKTQMKNQLETGDIISVDLLDRRWNGENYTVGTQVIAYVFKETRYNNEVKLYALQDLHDRYPKPNDYGVWRTIATRSWTLTPSKCNNITLLKQKLGAGLDPYGFNTSFDLGNFRTRPIQVNATIKDANFAIVLDFAKLINFSTTKKTVIIADRKELKSDVLAFKSNDDIKKENIKRYFDKIADTFKVKGEFNDIVKYNRMAARLFSRNSVYFLNANSSTLSDALTSINGYMFKIMKKIRAAEKEDSLAVENGVVPTTAVDRLSSDDDFKSFIGSLNEKYSQSLDWSVKNNEFVNKALKSLKEKIEATSSEEWLDKDLKVLSNLDKLSTEIHKYILSFKIETLEDIELLLMEIYFVRNLLRSERVGVHTLSNFFDRMRAGSYYSTPQYLYPSLTDRRNFYGNINNGVNSIITILNKKQALMQKD